MTAVCGTEIVDDAGQVYVTQCTVDHEDDNARGVAFGYPAGFCLLYTASPQFRADTTYTVRYVHIDIESKLHCNVNTSSARHKLILTFDKETGIPQAYEWR